MEPLLAPDDCARLRDALTATGYTVDRVRAVVGETAAAAMARGELAPALRTTTGGSPLETLTRVLLLGTSAPEADLAAALDPLPLPAALAAGLLVRAEGGYRTGLDLRPYGDEDGDWWVLSDLPAERHGRIRPDHVLGIGAASLTMAKATLRRPVGSALDLGVGSGVQSLHLGRHVAAVTGTDVNPRALRFAATTAALNGQRWELLAGEWFAPVAGRRFDLVVSNPPFVVGAGGARYAYRDSGIEGDGLTRRLLAEVPDLLADGGHAQFLANWLHVKGEDWRDRLGPWLAATGCDALVLQREVVDPAEYVATWLRDAGEDRDAEAAARAADWLDWFEAAGAESVAFGVVTLRSSGVDDPAVRLEESREPAAHLGGGEIGGWLDREGWLRDRAHDGDLLGARLRAAPDLRLEQYATRAVDAEGGWAVDDQVLRLASGLRWSAHADPVLVALVGGCDGATPLRDLVSVLAAAYDTPEPVLAAQAVPILSDLVLRGLLLPSE